MNWRAARARYSGWEERVWVAQLMMLSILRGQELIFGDCVIAYVEEVK